jgi:hypothetical protein
MTQEQQRVVQLETRFAELFAAYQSLALAVDQLYRFVETHAVLDSIEPTTSTVH